MIFIWGKNTRKEVTGIVADWCDLCGGIRAFTLTNIYSVSHVYYIPLGKGTFVGTVRQCHQCGSEDNCDARLYVNPLSTDAMVGRTLDAILQITNPQLDATLKKQQDFQNELARRTPNNPSNIADFDLGIANIEQKTTGVDPRMLNALNVLGTFDMRRREVAEYMEQVRKWDYLTASERETLLTEINSFHKYETAMNAVVSLLRCFPPLCQTGYLCLELLA